jgi:hypothetical protein
MKYFNIKIDKPDVYGFVISVDENKEAKESAKVMLGINSMELVLKNYENGIARYEAKIEGGNINLSISDKGNLEVIRKPKGKRIYLEEIDAKKAEEIIRNAQNLMGLMDRYTDNRVR